MNYTASIAAVVFSALGVCVGAAQESAPEEPPKEAPAKVQPEPSVAIDIAKRTVEFDGIVPIDVHDPDAPRVYLELVVCGRDSKEHESLVVADAKASEIHAALLALGLEPGSPATFEADDSERGWKSNPPEGPKVDIEFRWTDDEGNKHSAHPSQWIRGVDGEVFDRGPWIFSGSRFVKRQGQERYDADFSGTIVGLVTFGSEVLAWPTVMHNQAGLEEPEWIAKSDTVPVRGTRITVRLTVQPETTTGE